MLELFFVLLFGLLMLMVTKTFIWVLLYIVIYKVIAVGAYALFQGMINLDNPVMFIISRIVFFLLTFKIGTAVWHFTERYKIVHIIIIAIFVWIIYSVAINPPQGYYYHQVPDRSINNYI